MSLDSADALRSSIAVSSPARRCGRDGPPLERRIGTSRRVAGLSVGAYPAAVIASVLCTVMRLGWLNYEHG